MSADPSLPSPAPEILEYLTRHPDAQDTLDGIRQWWILDSCVRRWSSRVSESVEQLVSLGMLEETPASEGPIYYRASPSYRRAIRRETGSAHGQE